MAGKYSDLIDLPRPASRHPAMSMADRAAQFGSFAALSGFEQAIEETAGIYRRRMPPERSQPMSSPTYIAIDLKSFYASVECVDRGLDPLTAHLVVADVSRTEKTICLAVSPALKSYGISGRARLFEVVQRVNQVNAQRRRACEHELSGEAQDAAALSASPDKALGYIAAPPRMAHYIEVSTRIYQTYLRYIAPEDIHVYSIDEVFINAGPYMQLYRLSAHDLAMKLIRAVLAETGITATAGIGPNLYLCKVAMDIVAKHMPADAQGVRVAQLTERSYREKLWDHTPLTDFWRVGPGYAKKLNRAGLYTMGDIARCSMGRAQDYYNEELLFELFGVNAELLIDHAWGYEPCTIAEIKRYKPRSASMGEGQVLSTPYTAEKARLVVREMADKLALELVDKGLVTDQLVLTVGYDIENLTDPVRSKAYKGPIVTDHYGRKIPKHAHGSENLGGFTSSTRHILQAVDALFRRIVNEQLLVRRLNLVAAHVMPPSEAPSSTPEVEQLDLFTDYAARTASREAEQAALEREKRMQQAVLSIQKKYGKNAILKGMNLEEGATARDRNSRIGGHKAE